ncbi:MAG TPA: GNAT family N-acetyltransferase [Dehalococcoidales bacterium]|nr:GNAT family N-acetyltransferase [Dehalococcoidales bacterium]
MLIRPMNEQDKQSILEILYNTPEFNPMDLAVAIEVIDDYLQNPVDSGYNIMVAEIDSNIAGYICYGHNSMTVSTWEIYWIAVSHNLQGQGIGRQLMAEAEENIRKAGGKLIVLETSSTSLYDKTNRFYINLDYKIDCQIKDYYAPNDDMILYEKRIL